MLGVYTLKYLKLLNILYIFRLHNMWITLKNSELNIEIRTRYQGITKYLLTFVLFYMSSIIVRGVIADIIYDYPGRERLMVLLGSLMAAIIIVYICISLKLGHILQLLYEHLPILCKQQGMENIYFYILFFFV